jgi:transaldolase/glucose-6-phosphate isomerase
MTLTALQQAQRLGQGMWIDYMRRGLLTSGEFQELIAQGISGATSNPTIFEKAIDGSTDYDEDLLDKARAGQDKAEIYEQLAIEDIGRAADLLRPLYDRTGGGDGYVSLEVSPHLAYDTERTIAEAKRLFTALGRPNVMIKVPATPEGIPAIRQLISDGLNINVTLIFSLEMYRQVREAYIAGLEGLLLAGGDISRVASVASFFLSRVDVVVDRLLEERIRRGQNELKSLLGGAAIANAKLAYQAFRDAFGGERFADLKARGARVQRPLWASTGTKDPAYSDVMYIGPLIGADTVNTMPPATINAFLDHGRVASTIELGAVEAQQTIEALEAAGINMEQVTARLMTDGVQLFVDSFQKLFDGVEEKKVRLLALERAHTFVSLGAHSSAVSAHLDRLQKENMVARIWRKDHTVWKPSQEEITNRLGWLHVSDLMREQVSTLIAFADEVRAGGFRHAVLLGMGGASLGAEMLHRTFGSAEGYPEFIMLDSTVPDWIRAVTGAIDPARTLFLISSKSGGTAETLFMYKHFRSLVETVNKENAGQNFVAITDAGSSLSRMAEETGFRCVFLNPSDIGGRYSVLSYFGLVPAALMGIDIVKLLDRVDSMREGCASCVVAKDNPGFWLGTIIGALAGKGRDKLTLVTSPAINSFGLWLEQLIAESTGKEGTGILPVACEPLDGAESYGDDRLFVCLRLEGDDNAAVDAAMEDVKSAGHPVVGLELRDRYDLGTELFRWEFATAVAGAILGINPFDQPNVQAAKDATKRVLQEYQASGRLPAIEAPGSLTDLLAEARPGDYLAIMAYLCQAPETEAALTELQRRARAKHQIATTAGYGPRLLHSTGQLHKGGPNTGLFFQVTVAHTDDLPIPGEPYSFGVLADAQALGDLQTLQAMGRRVARLHLTEDAGEALKKLASEME